MPVVTFDPEKNAANRAKHGIDFDEVELFEWDRAVFEDDRDVRHERRFRFIGPIGTRLVFLVCEFLGEDAAGEEIVRVISVRPCDKKEIRRYEQQS